MKKAFYLLTMLFLTASFTLMAQDVPPAGTPYMSLSVVPDTDVVFDLGRAGEDGPIWIDAGDGNYTKMDVTYAWYGYITVHSLSDYIRIYGSLREFEILDQEIYEVEVQQLYDLQYLDVCGNRLTELDLTQNVKIERLMFNYNQITRMDLTHNVKLYHLYARQNRLTQLLVSDQSPLDGMYADGNLLEACALDSLYLSLPISSNLPYIVLDVRGDGDNPGNLTSNTSLATERGWYVCKWISSGTFEPIYGDGTGCPNLNVEENNEIQFSMFPNPATTEINVKCETGIKNVEIVNFLGQVVDSYSYDNRQSAHIQCDYPAGMYLVRITTDEGCATQKIMVK